MLRALVERLKGAGCLRTPEVEAAFLHVPRHLFLPDVEAGLAYRDEAIVTRVSDGVPISSSSQPSIMAIMLEQLGLRPGQRVLEVGAGTGYNAALLAHMVGEAGLVVTMDIDEDIVRQAREHLDAAGYGRVRVVCGDGWQGYPEAAPYDRIVLTVGAWDISPAWLEQLRPGGRLVLPLSIAGGMQKSIAFRWAGDHLMGVSTADCGFMMLRGQHSAPEVYQQLGPSPGLALVTEDASVMDIAGLYSALAGPHTDWPTGVNAWPREVFGSLGVWLALRERGSCSLGATEQAASRHGIPWMFRWHSGYCSVVGLAEGAGIALLTRPPGMELPAGDPLSAPPFELFVRGYGPGDGPARRLMDSVRAWDMAGRPSARGIHVRAYPRHVPCTPTPEELVVEKRWTRLVISWRS